MGKEMFSSKGSPNFEEVKRWLSSNGLSIYAPIFQEQECDNMAVLLTMQESDLKDLGIDKVGARRKFLNAIEAQKKDQKLTIGTRTRGCVLCYIVRRP